MLLILIIVPNLMPVHRGNKEAEVKRNVHEIQVALERYAVDHNGEYPPYLVGGEARFSTVIHRPGFQDEDYRPEDRWELTNARNIGKQEHALDILVREGYLVSYPKNPFATNGPAIHEYQEKMSDPLRNGTLDARMRGTRFGACCTLMGNVLADYRYRNAAFGYPFYDMWETNKPKPFLPGSFFYKSMGPANSDAIEKAKAGEPLVPSAVTSYMLGGYGAIRTKGQDVLGPEPMFDVGGVKVHAWTRSTMHETDETGSYLGSPYGVVEAGSELAIPGTLAYGNPNGIRDGIILVLTPAEESGQSR